MNPPRRIFLDTNVFIIGAADAATPEAAILDWLGWEKGEPGATAIVVSEELLDQIARVGRRLRGKDWASAIIQRLWFLNLWYVVIAPQSLQVLMTAGPIPREDVSVYLTARTGQAECFISANHKLIRALVETTQDFECLTPADFVARYLKS